MIRTARKLASVIATGALVMGSLATPVFATTNAEIGGNGSGSTNTTDITQTNTQTVVQNNSADIHNDVTATSNTGNNQANDNTGGSTMVSTGNATNNVNLSTKVNMNSLTMPTSLSAPVNTDIGGNGSGSTNTIDVTKENTSSVYQTNDANIHNDVHANAATGDNQANRNTGGDVKVVTGDATNNVTVKNAANANVIGTTGTGSGSSADAFNAEIGGNGSGSTNTIDLTKLNDATIVQSNDAYIRNHIDEESRTGSNNLNDNTGGSVLLGTGDAKSNVTVDNMANFNFASVGSFVSDPNVEIGGNGSGSTNTFDSTVANDSSIFQNGENCGITGLDLIDHLGGCGGFKVFNKINYDPVTGDNSLNRNTDGDVLTLTGDAMSNTTVTNHGNANIISPMGSVTLPGGDMLHFNFDMGALFAGMHL